MGRNDSKRHSAGKRVCQVTGRPKSKVIRGFGEKSQFASRELPTIFDYTAAASRE